jgi:hypothetical protein
MTRRRYDAPASKSGPEPVVKKSGKGGLEGSIPGVVCHMAALLKNVVESPTHNFVNVPDSVSLRLRRTGQKNVKSIDIFEALADFSSLVQAVKVWYTSTETVSRVFSLATTA